MKNVLLSAILFIFPFFYPCTSYTLFFFLMPLIYSSFTNNNLTLKKGFLWGVIVFGLHLLWFWSLVFFESAHPLRITFIVLTVSWFSSLSGLWFYWLSMALKGFTTKFNFLIVWLLNSLLFFLFIIKGSLFILGNWEGYVLFNPFIPLAYYPQLIWCLGKIGLFGGLIILILFQLFVVIGICYKQKHFYLVAIIMLCPFLAGFMYYHHRTINSSYMYFVKPWWYTQSKDSIYCGYRMVHDVSRAIVKHPKIEVIVLPESSFPGEIEANNIFVSMLTDCNEHVIVIMSAYKKIEKKLYNGSFIIQDGTIMQTYFKQHLMPLVERNSKVLNFFGFTSLLNPVDSFFERADSDQIDTVNLSGDTFQLFICSELYFEAKPIKGIPILFLGNDFWFYMSYAKTLSYLFYDYISILYQVPIIFGTTEGKTNICSNLI